MNIDETFLPQNSEPKKAYKEMGIFLLFVFGGMFLANFIGILAVLPLFDWQIEHVINLVNDPLKPEAKIPLLIIQGITAFSMFIACPLLYIKMYEQNRLNKLFGDKIEGNKWSILAVLIPLLVIMFMPFNATIIEWNQSWIFPDWLGQFEDWARAKEKSAEEITLALTNLQTFGEILLGAIIFAILPAIGEELVFRGVIQPKLKQMGLNIHVAIWLTGFIFSAIHIQFYGLIPRMLLGVMFGYIYYWSGDLKLPIIAHFTNNGFTILMILLRNHQIIDIDIEHTTHIPLEAAAGSGIVCALIMGSIWYLTKKKDYFTENLSLDTNSNGR